MGKRKIRTERQSEREIRVKTMVIMDWTSWIPKDCPISIHFRFNFSPSLHPSLNTLLQCNPHTSFNFDANFVFKSNSNKRKKNTITQVLCNEQEGLTTEGTIRKFRQIFIDDEIQFKPDGHPRLQYSHYQQNQESINKKQQQKIQQQTKPKDRK